MIEARPSPIESPGVEPLGSDMFQGPEADIARTVILQCVTTMITALIGAWSFSFAAWAGEGRLSGRLEDRRPKQRGDQLGGAA